MSLDISLKPIKSKRAKNPRRMKAVCSNLRAETAVLQERCETLLASAAKSDREFIPRLRQVWDSIAWIRGNLFLLESELFNWRRDLD